MLRDSLTMQGSTSNLPPNISIKKLRIFTNIVRMWVQMPNTICGLTISISSCHNIISMFYSHASDPMKYFT